MKRRGFTLIEMMTVMGIIVLIIGLAVPAFKALSGNRSTEVATNVLSATLGVARATAMSGGQAIRYGQSSPRSAAGICIFPDPATGATKMALVDADENGYVDIIPDTDIVPLTTGVAAQIAMGVFPASGSPPSDVFLSFGVIMFNPNGTISTTRYVVPQDPATLPTGAAPNALRPLAQLANVPVTVSPGLVVALLDQPTYADQAYPVGDWVIGNNGWYAPGVNYATTIGQENQREAWIASHGLFVAVNQTTGTLVKPAP